MPVYFKVTKTEARVIDQIAARALRLFEHMGLEDKPRRWQIAMDVAAVHSNGCPLRLQELLGARDEDFAHDIGGIRRHLDRETGKLRDCFLPRCAC